MGETEGRVESPLVHELVLPPLDEVAELVPAEQHLRRRLLDDLQR